jgi:hypothetical protein
MKNLAAICLILASAAIAQATFVGDSYVLGTWSGVVNTYTSTGSTADSKYWEYQDVSIGSYNNTTSGRVPAWFTQKYTSATLFNKMDQKYTDGYLQDDLAGAAAYIDISTDNATWTRVWSLTPSTWTNYFPTTWQTFTFAATNTLYVRHGVTMAYSASWQMIPAWSADSAGVKLYAAPEPVTMSLLGLGGLLALSRKK